MKFKNCICWLIIFFAINQVTAQSGKDFLQIVQTVEVTMKGGGMEFPKGEVVFYIAANKVKTISQQAGGKLEILYSDSSKTATTLVSMMGAQQRITDTNMLVNANRPYDSIVVQETADSEVIHTIACKKAVIRLYKGNNKEERVVWYNPAIQLPFAYNFGVVGLDLIKGLPVQYENTLMGMQMLHTVTRISIETEMDAGIFTLSQ